MFKLPGRTNLLPLLSKENSAAVKEVPAVTEEMIAQVKEVSASAHKFANQSRRLLEVVAQFKL